HIGHLIHEPVRGLPALELPVLLTEGRVVGEPRDLVLRSRSPVAFGSVHRHSSWPWSAAGVVRPSSVSQLWWAASIFAAIRPAVVFVSRTGPYQPQSLQRASTSAGHHPAVCLTSTSAIRSSLR